MKNREEALLVCKDYEEISSVDQMATYSKDIFSPVDECHAYDGLFVPSMQTVLSDFVKANCLRIDTLPNKWLATARTGKF